MRRIWFNHWFSQAYHFMNSLKHNPENYLIASGERDMVYKVVVDEYYLEPVFEDAMEYVSWCLEFCQEHQIDVLYPRRHMDTITLHADKFNSINVKLILDTNVFVHNLLQSKLASCKYMEDNNLCSVPKMIAVSNFSEFLDAYEALKNIYG